MADLPSILHRIQIEQTDFRSPVSESLAQALGETMNYIADHFVVHPGMILEYGGLESGIEPGWHPCDGRALSRTVYAELFAKIGTLHGIGDGLTTFNLPDHRGLFARMVDTTTVGARGFDPDEAGRIPVGTGTAQNPGSFQSYDIEQHQHFVGTNAGGSGASVQSSGDSPQYNQATSNTGGNETRPKNTYVLKIIKD